VEGKRSRGARGRGGVEWCVDWRPGLALFIVARGAVARHCRASSSTRLQWRRGVGDDARMLATSRRSSRASWRSRRGTGWLGRRQSLPRVPAEIVDDGVIYRARAGRWACLGAAWSRGAAMGERRGREVDGVSGVASCTVVSRGVPVHALARHG
jgi:hypothetical protein